MDVNMSARDRLSSRDVICQTIIQPDGTNWSHQVALYRSEGGCKHSRLEHTNHRRPCCIVVQTNKNTANWKTVITTVGWNQKDASSGAVSVCRGTKTLSVGTKWPQRVVLYRSAGKQKHFRLEPNGRNKPCSVGLQGNTKQPVGTNLTARMKLLIAFSSFPSLHHRKRSISTGGNITPV